MSSTLHHQMPHFHSFYRYVLWIGLLCTQTGLCILHAADPATSEYRWWKGNLHTHTLWSDGDDFPEMVADWYRTNGYHFLALSDHNVLQDTEKWIGITNLSTTPAAVEKYVQRYGSNWVEFRERSGVRQVRLKKFEEYRSRVEAPGRFMLLPASEITTRYQIWPVHVNASNLQKPIEPPTGSSVLDVMQKTVDAILQQRRETQQPILPHINHPNFGYAITGEDLSQLRGEQFFEVYNGHPDVHNFGDGTRLGTEAIWDVALTIRRSKTKLGVLYGLATDDSHRYHQYAPSQSNPGRGWVMVRARKLNAGELIAAMEDGDFYSSSGVELEEVERERTRLRIRVKQKPGVNYIIRFIGTPRVFDASSEAIIAKDGRPYPTTRRYRPEVGMVLGEVRGPEAVYQLSGSELYVRAVVISSELKKDSTQPGECEAAWVQPLIPAAN